MVLHFSVLYVMYVPWWISAHNSNKSNPQPKRHIPDVCDVTIGYSTPTTMRFEPPGSTLHLVCLSSIRSPKSGVLESGLGTRFWYPKSGIRNPAGMESDSVSRNPGPSSRHLSGRILESARSDWNPLIPPLCT